MNSTKELLYAGLIGFVFGAFLHYMPGADLHNHIKLKSECEKSLPRDKTCKLIAVIDDETNKR